VSDALIDMSYAERVAQPCIGQERADLVLAGCAILEALLRVWPCQRLRVADRGLREGILATLMSEDGHGGAPHHRHHRWPHVATGSS
jgi:exopolyphosphatase/guanosine-5'-triphosphate,3'-diphosphate pyrophosphatase